MTAISVAHAGKPDMKHMDRHFIAQSYAAWNGIRQGGWVKTEQDPVDPMTGTPAEPGMSAIGHLEDAVTKAGGAVLRYGWFYGPGATDDLVEPVRKRQFPVVRRWRATVRGCISTTRRARERSGRCGSRPGWPGRWPERWR